MPQSVVAEGVNYRVVLDGAIVRIVVWRMPEVPSGEAAADFELATERVRAMAATSGALLLDAREAPKVAGPRTAAALGALFGAFAARKKRVAVVISDDALQQLQMRRLLSESIPQHGATFAELADAESWLASEANARQ